jgi:hypothetical protein
MKRVLAVGLTLCTMLSLPMWAQSTAQIHGSVQDSSGAAVPSAEIKATQTDTGFTRTVTSGADGGYVLTNLPIGPYRLEISKGGFSTAVQTGIVLQVNTDPLVDVVVRVGQVNEQVNVEANAALVETRSSGIGEVIQNQRIVELPLNGRNITDLVTLGGAAVQTGTSDTRFFSGRPYISIGGGASFTVGGATDWNLDGANHYDFLAGTAMPLAFPDAVQEFKVETSGLTATRGSSSSVEIVTKSGTNALHGDLFYFIRNDGFGSAHEYFANRKSTYKRNQFGGVVGGPLIKNRLFAFGGVQISTIRESPWSSTAIVPTQQMIDGDFTTFASAACNGGVPRTLTGPLAGLTVPVANMSAPARFIAQKVLAGLAADGVKPDPCGRVLYNNPRYENTYQYVARVDYQISEKHSMFFRMLDTKQRIPSTLTLSQNLLNASGVGVNTPVYTYAYGDTYVINPNMVNSLRLAFTRLNETRLPNDYFSYCTAGVNMWCGANPTQFGILNIAGFWSSGSSFVATDPGNWYRTANYSINDDVSWVRGAHQMTLGVSAFQGRLKQRNSFAATGQFQFQGGGLTGTAQTNFLMGSAATFLQGLPNDFEIRENFVGLYFTDAWRINSRLTLNVGLRWSPYLPQTVVNGHIYHFDLARFQAGTKSQVFLNAPPGFYYPGDNGFPGMSGIYRRYNQWAPRIGLVWDPTGDGKTSIRASYSYAYAYFPGLTREDQAGHNPWGGRTSATGVNFANPWAALGGVSPLPYTVSPNTNFTPRGLFVTTDYDTPTPTVSTWNFAIQRQFGTNWLVSATYMGSAVRHLLINVPINPANPNVPGASVQNTDARRILQSGNLLSAMAKWNAGGNQSYNAMLFSVQRRLTRGLAVSGNWTWSHCIGQLLGFATKADQTITDPNRIDLPGNCDADRRHIVNLTAVYETPKFANRGLSMAATGWKISGIYKFTSGTWLMIQDGTDVALTGINHQQPNLVKPNEVYTGKSGPNDFYLNRTAFATQGAGVPTGNLGWNSIVGPTLWGIDLALSRQFQIREGQSIEIRADAFNLTNSFVAAMAANTQFGTAFGQPPVGPNFSIISSPLFGQILGAQPTRKMQFALKYTF